MKIVYLSVADFSIIKLTNLFISARGARAFYHKRKTVYAQERCQYDLQAKRRRLFGHRSDQEASSESISSFRDKALRGNKSGMPAIWNRGPYLYTISNFLCLTVSSSCLNALYFLSAATGVSSSGSGHKASVQSKDPRGSNLFLLILFEYLIHNSEFPLSCNTLLFLIWDAHLLRILPFEVLIFAYILLIKSVNFRIKSFKVPELYIEVPETATIGSLKVRF